jgi:Flp pilus assembly protein TadG
VLPVLIGIVVGCVDLGRGVQSQITLTNAVREGAIYGATTGFTDYSKDDWIAEVRERVTDEMSNVNGFQAGDLTVDVTTTEVNDQVCLTVTATYVFETLIDWPGMPSRIDLDHAIRLPRYR